MSVLVLHVFVWITSLSTCSNICPAFNYHLQRPTITSLRFPGTSLVSNAYFLPRRGILSHLRCSCSYFLVCRDLDLVCRDLDLVCRDLDLVSRDIDLVCRGLDLLFRDLYLLSRDLDILRSKKRHRVTREFESRPDIFPCDRNNTCNMSRSRHTKSRSRYTRQTK